MSDAIAKREALSDALMKVKAVGNRTTEAYRALMRAYLNSGTSVDVEGFAAYVESLKGKKSASLVNLTLSAGRKAFMQAGERLGLPARELAVIRGALASIPRVKIAPPEVETVTPDERAVLMSALPLRVRLVAEVLYVTGARVSEIVNLRRDHVKMNGHVELRIMGKGSKERTAKIPRGLYRRIVEVFPEGEYLFVTGPGHAFKREYISREIARAAKRVLGRSVSAHVLRHSRATDLLKATHRIKAVSRLLGHTDEAVTLRYYVKDAFSDEELFAGIEETKA